MCQLTNNELPKLCPSTALSERLEGEGAGLGLSRQPSGVLSRLAGSTGHLFTYQPICQSLICCMGDKRDVFEQM